MHRRELFRSVAALGVGTATFHRALAAEAAQEPKEDKPSGVTPEMVKNAEWVAGITLTDEERTRIAGLMTRAVNGFKLIRKIDVPNSVPPALQFNPTPGNPFAVGPRGTVEAPKVESAKPESADDLAFLPLAKLAHLVRTGQVS